VILQNAIYSCDGKAEFSASLRQSSVSRDPSEINCRGLAVHYNPRKNKGTGKRSELIRTIATNE